MPRVFICYDIKKTTPDPHPVLLNLANDYGFEFWLPMEDGELKRLPNTTLVGSFSVAPFGLRTGWAVGGGEGAAGGDSRLFLIDSFDLDEPNQFLSSRLKRVH